jgi:2-keto-4-pentenoate hydratase/2-oxohepta-3-ene-1,7-dioic acid hydratase in catechol pathway
LHATDKLIWTIREIIADLSTYHHLQPGEIIYSGTPEIVAAVALNVGPAEQTLCCPPQVFQAPCHEALARTAPERSKGQIHRSLVRP